MARIHRMTKKRLGELLLDEDLITEEQVQEVLKEQKASGGLFGEILVRKSYVTESDIARAIARQFSIPFISTAGYSIPDDVIDLFPFELLERYQFVPIDRFGEVITVVIAGVMDRRVLEQIEEITGCSVQVYAGIASDVRNTLERLARERAKREADAKKRAKKTSTPAKDGKTNSG